MREEDADGLPQGEAVGSIPLFFFTKALDSCPTILDSPTLDPCALPLCSCSLQLHGRLAALADAVELLHKKASTKGAETKLLKAMQRVCKLPTLQQVGALMRGDGCRVW